MFTEVAQDDVGRRYYAGLYSPGCLTALPWGEEPFDCVVFLCDPGRAQGLDTELARANVDWVQVAGNGAEALHDAIDGATGRHGARSPMTSWHNEARSVEEMAEVASLCFGGHERVLVLVVGQAPEFQASVKALQRSLQR